VSAPGPLPARWSQRIRAALAGRSRQQVAILVALVLVGLASWYLLPAPASLQDVSLEVSQLEDLQVLPEFRLARVGGEFTRADLALRWNFLFFGYTNCPNACPTTLAAIARVQQALRSQGLPVPGGVFISVDPRRDSPALAQRYAAAFGPDMLGVVADGEASAKLLRFLGVAVHVNDEGAVGSAAGGTTTGSATGRVADYTVDHTTGFYLLSPGARWRASFAPAEDVEAILADTSRLVQLPVR
jgi:protein SCO1/2